jgi:hypothetical protein
MKDCMKETGSVTDLRLLLLRDGPHVGNELVTQVVDDVRREDADLALHHHRMGRTIWSRSHG